MIISILDFLLIFIETSSIEAGVGNGDMDKKDTEAGGETHTLQSMEIKPHYAAFFDAFNDCFPTK